MQGRRRLALADNQSLATPSEPGFRRFGSVASPEGQLSVLLESVRKINNRSRKFSSFDRREKVGAYRPDRD